MDFKSFPFECKVNEEKNIFEGYASVFGNKDSHSDIIEPGAFAKTLQESSGRVKVLWQHDPWSPIGKPVKMQEDSRGLYVEGKISETTLGKDALILMKDGVINELSIGYQTIKYNIDNDSKTRHLTELKLFEFSPVTWASNQLANITGVKNRQQGIDNLLFSLNQELKAGQVLSAKNKELVTKAIEALQALLKAAEPDDSTSKNQEPLIDIVNDPDYQSLMKELQSFKTKIKGGNQ